MDSPINKPSVPNGATQPTARGPLIGGELHVEMQQLWQRYWAGETSPEEDERLCGYILSLPQAELPEEMSAYKAYFASLATLRSASLTEAFDQKVLRLLDESKPAVVVKARPLSWTSRLFPLARAAAVVAVVIGVGVLLQHSWSNSEPTEQVVAAADTIISTHPSAPSVAQGQDEAVDPATGLAGDAVDYQRWDSLQRL